VENRAVASIDLHVGAGAQLNTVDQRLQQVDGRSCSFASSKGYDRI
jgi:hypothetical protein